MKKVIITAATLESYLWYVKHINANFALLPEQNVLMGAFGEMQFPSGEDLGASAEPVDRTRNTIVKALSALTPSRDALILTAQKDGLRIQTGNLALTQEEDAQEHYVYLSDESDNKLINGAFAMLHSVIKVTAK